MIIIHDNQFSNLDKEKTIKCDFGLPDSAAPVGLSVLNVNKT